MENKNNTLQLGDIHTMLQEQGYITNEQVAMSVFLSLQLNKPLLIEGPAGVGKTEIAECRMNILGIRHDPFGVSAVQRVNFESNESGKRRVFNLRFVDARLFIPQRSLHWQLYLGTLAT